MAKVLYNHNICMFIRNLSKQNGVNRDGIKTIYLFENIRFNTAVIRIKAGMVSTLNFNLPGYLSIRIDFLFFFYLKNSMPQISQ